MVFKIGLSARAVRVAMVILIGVAAAAVAVQLPSDLPAANAATPAPMKGVAGCPGNDALGASWWYNWESIRPANCANKGFVPMVSGRPPKEKPQADAGDIEWNRTQAVNAGTRPFSASTSRITPTRRRCPSPKLSNCGRR